MACVRRAPDTDVNWWRGTDRPSVTWDVELLPCGSAYTWILADLHTLARHCYSAVSPNKIIHEEVDCGFLNRLHGDCWFCSPFGSRGGAVCPPLEVGCHVTPLEVARGLSGEDVSVAASGTDRAWRIGMTFCGGGLSGLRPVLTRVSRRWTGRRQWPIMCGLWGGLLKAALCCWWRGADSWRWIKPRRVCVGRRPLVVGQTMGQW